MEKPIVSQYPVHPERFSKNVVLFNVRRKYKKKVIDIEFSKTQIDFMKKIGISFNFSNISDDDYILIEEKVSDYLQKKGFNEDYTPNRDGEMCESILDMFDV